MIITESRLNQVIRECFDEVMNEIQERNAHERGMSDDQVVARRIEREKNGMMDKHRTGDPGVDAITKQAIDKKPDKEYDWHRLLRHDIKSGHPAERNGGNAEDRYFDRYGEKIDEAVSNGAKLILQMQELVNQANQAYENAKQVTEDDTCLMGGRDNPQYGLAQPITFSRGNVIIVTVSPYEREPYKEVIKCFRTVRGVTVKFSDDDAYPYGGYQYAVKTLRSIIRDAQRGIQYFHEMDPNWDDKTQERYNKKFGM